VIDRTQSAFPTIRRCFWPVVFVCVVGCASAAAQSTTPVAYKGRLVSDVLNEFRKQGVSVVFSDGLVTPSMRVTVDPRATTPRSIMGEILAAHGLALQEGGRGVLLVVRSQPRAPARAPAASLPEGTSEVGWVEGVVLDQQTQRPVPSAVVLVDATDAFVVAGDDGRFKIEGIASGVRTIRVEAPGYEPMSSPELKISPRRGMTVTIEMVASPQFRETVTVTALSDPRPAGVVTSGVAVTSEEIRRSAGSFGDVNRFIQALPGVAGGGDIRNDLVARGGSPAENLTRIDGFETPTLSHFSTTGSTAGVITLLNSELIEGATFLAGGFPVEYGDRLSSVLDIRLREGSRTRHAFEADVNFAGVALVGEGPLGKRGSWIGSLRRSFVDLFANSAGVVSVPEMSAWTFKAVYDVGRRHRLWTVAVGGAEKLDFNLDDNEPDEPDFTGIQQRAARVVLGAGWRHLLWTRAFGVASMSTSSVNYKIDIRDRLLAGDTLVLRDHSNENATTIRYDLTWQTPRNVTLQGGASVKSLWRGLDLRQPRGVQRPYSILPRENTPGVTLDFETSSPISAAYVHAAAPVLPRTTLTGGIRVETYEALGHATVAAPRGGIEVRASPAVRLGISAGRYHQQPELLTVVALAQNAGLAPIESDHLVGGLKYEPRPGLLVSAEVYRKWYRSYPASLDYPQLTLANHGGEFNTSDVLLLPMSSEGKGYSRGVELFLRKRLSGGAYGQVAYSWSRTRQAALEGVLRRGSFDTPHVLTALGGYRLGERWTLSGRLTYASGHPYTPALLPESADQNRFVYDVARFNGERAPAFHRLDVRVDRQFSLFGRNTSLFADMQNVYNHQSVITYEWNQKERRLHAEKQLGFLPVVGLNVEF
jgi:hypothetical protein